MDCRFFTDAVCYEPCVADIVESIPTGICYPTGITYVPTTNAWLEILSKARTSVDIASFYWSLTDDSNRLDPSSSQGVVVLQKLIELLEKRITIRIVVNKPRNGSTFPNLNYLSSRGANVRYIDIGSLMGGVLHTKFIVVDTNHFYLGSANMDWRSLTQVKELGILIRNCKCLATDLIKIFEQYWSLENTQTLPYNWPGSVDTRYNSFSPLNVNINNVDSLVYISSSPLVMCPSGRTDDLQSITKIMDDANNFIYVSVMQYEPIFFNNRNEKTFWSNIDDHIRKTAFNRRIKIRLLVSYWEKSDPLIKPFLLSLIGLSTKPRITIEAKLFVVPESVPKIPFTRVNHAKFMVTDNSVYVGTSNWTGNYFLDTCGVSLRIYNNEDLRKKLENIFMRDWNSQYSFDLNEKIELCNCKLDDYSSEQVVPCSVAIEN